VAQACEALADRVKNIAAALLEVSAQALQVGPAGVVHAASGRHLSLAEIAHAWYRQPQRMPADVDPAGLEVMVGYKAGQDTGTFSYAAHACALTSSSAAAMFFTRSASASQACATAPPDITAQREPQVPVE
jgi:carbon-monoxide dehydrogenase large subunit